MPAEPVERLHHVARLVLDRRCWPRRGSARGRSADPSPSRGSAGIASPASAPSSSGPPRRTRRRRVDRRTTRRSRPRPGRSSGSRPSEAPSISRRGAHAVAVRPATSLVPSSTSASMAPSHGRHRSRRSATWRPAPATTTGCRCRVTKSPGAGDGRGDLQPVDPRGVVRRGLADPGAPGQAQRARPAARSARRPRRRTARAWVPACQPHQRC